MKQCPAYFRHTAESYTSLGRVKKRKENSVENLAKSTCGQVLKPRLYRLSPEVDVGDILEFFGSDTFT